MHSFHLFSAEEKAHWASESSIPWHQFEKFQLTEQQAMMIKNDALAIWAALPATEKLLHEKCYGGEFVSFLTSWFEKEQKHAGLLIEYLQRFWPQLMPTEEELELISSDFALVPSLESLMLHFCRELRLMQWFKTSARGQTEPVIKKVYRVISRDEARHAAAYFQYMEQAIRHYGDEARIAFSKAAALMLSRMRTQAFPPAGLHYQQGFYPSDLFYQQYTDSVGLSYGQNSALSLGYDWEQKSIAAILSNTGHLLGERFADERALNQYRKTRIAASYNQAGFY